MVEFVSLPVKSNGKINKTIKKICADSTIVTKM